MSLSWMKTKMGSVVGGVVMAVVLLGSSGVHAQVSIQANGLFVVGREKTLGCFMQSADTFSSSFPLAWFKDGVPQTASQQQQVPVTSNVIAYNSFYKFNVSAADNLAVITCRATFAASTTQDSWTVYVYKGPNKPVVSGPSTVVSQIPSTWTCLVDGASNSAPDVFWQFGNNSRLDPSTFTSTTQIYTDTDQLQIHKVTNTLTLTVTPGAPSFTLECRAVHFDTSTESSSDFPVTVLYPPQITGGNVNYTVTEGSMATLYCQVTAYPILTSVTWYKNGYRLNPSSSGRLTGGTVSSPSLVISGVVKSDGGLYMCGATNSQGSTNGTINLLTVRYQPVVSYSQNPVTGVAGSSLTLSCIIDAYPRYTTVFWFRINSNTGAKTQISPTINPGKYVNGTASTTAALSILSLEVGDAGLYRCVVDNDVARGEGPNLLVDVSSQPYAPILTLASTSYVVDVTAGSLTLQCSYDGNPSPSTVTWTKDSQYVDVIGSSGKYAGSSLAFPSLTILQLSSSDAGQYVCRATNYLGQGLSDVITVVVNYPPEFLTPGITQFSQEETTLLTLPCEFSSYPSAFAVQWLKNGLPLSTTNSGLYSGGTLATPNLTILSLTSDDAGLYSCQVTNGLGTTSGVALSVTVLFKPQITGGQSTITATEPQSATLTCQVSSLPALDSLTWVKDGQPLDTSDPLRYSGGTVSSPSLTIASVGASDSGQYFCRAANSLGSTDGAVTTLSVNYFPMFTIFNTTITGTLGGSVTLAVAIASNPALTSVQWRKRDPAGTYQVVSGGRYQGGTVVSPSLQILGVTNADSGQYYVVAVNSLGQRQSADIELTVISLPSTPTVTNLESSYQEGDPITLSCQSSSSPSPTLRWYLGSTLVSSGPVLTISQAAVSNDGQQYRCDATNALGTTSTDVTLHVLYKPRASSSLTDVTAVVGQTVTLTCAVLANPVPSSYRWTRNGQVLSTSGPLARQLTVTVNDVTDVGQYTCEATNSVGTSDPINVNINEGGDTGNTAASTGSSGLSTATLVLIIIIIIIIVVVCVLIIVYCIATGKCSKKKNDVGPTQAPPPPPPTVSSYSDKPGYYSRGSAPSSHITMEETKAAAVNGYTPRHAGVTISLPGGHSPRPHHLPPLGQDGVPLEKESARDEDGTKERKKKKKRRRQHQDPDADVTPRRSDNYGFDNV